MLGCHRAVIGPDVRPGLDRSDPHVPDPSLPVCQTISATRMLRTGPSRGQTASRTPSSSWISRPLMRRRPPTSIAGSWAGRSRAARRGSSIGSSRAVSSRSRTAPRSGRRPSASRHLQHRGSSTRSEPTLCRSGEPRATAPSPRVYVLVDDRAEQGDLILATAEKLGVTILWRDRYWASRRLARVVS